jgi:hypothetical protein
MRTRICIYVRSWGALRGQSPRRGGDAEAHPCDEAGQAEAGGGGAGRRADRAPSPVLPLAGHG